MCTFDVEFGWEPEVDVLSDMVQVHAVGRRFKVSWRHTATLCERRAFKPFHRVKACTFGVDLQATGSGNMAADIWPGDCCMWAEDL